MTELYPFLESKEWHLGILWSCDLLVKTINTLAQSPMP